jgi:hypothetical protein
VTCIRVVGNRAIAGGVVEQSSEPFAPERTFALVQATDNGSPGAGEDTSIGLLQADPVDALTCPFFAFPEVPIVQGNVLVQPAGTE